MTEKDINHQTDNAIAMKIKKEVSEIKSKLSKHKRRYTIDDFTQYHNEEFIENTFKGILERTPSLHEREFFLQQLYSGERSKTEILVELHFSQEGRKHNVVILGIKKRYLITKLYRIPIIGIFVKILITLIRLPKRLNAFEAYSHSKFIDFEILKVDHGVLKADFSALKSEYTINDIPDSIEEEVDDFYNYALSQFTPQTKSTSCDQKELYYSLFEHAFYHHEAVMLKQKVYTKYIPDFNSKDIPHLDVGCGRGELLDILQKNNSIVKGIDINGIEIEILQKKGYNVEHIDIITYLQNTQEQYSSISALQVIEHLDYETLRKFIELSYKTLAYDGTIILETINPHNAFTLGSFYMDETHVRLLPPEMVAFMLQWYGFKEIKVVYSSPMPKKLRYNVTGRDYHDYALIGYKR